MEIKNHFGVYGVCLQEGKLLCIEKTRGPYQHRFDLPGGSQEVGEGLTETLKREVLEETGYMLSQYLNPRIYDVLVHEEGQDFAVHHIMAFYDIVLDLERSQKSLPQEVFDGSNDSANTIWVPIEQMTQENASPLVLKAKAELRGFPELDKTSYMNWKVKHAKSTGF
ncbi:NUDIX hydrolase [Streptococcus sp. 20925_1_44]|uniref:NUDIX hydrolase n=1 Tax=Streptococcus sp. 20925_1_44 TaxID=3003666 RepID=UPI00352FE909